MERFRREAFDLSSEPDRVRLCAELADALTLKVRPGADLHATARAAVDELRRLGHDLWGFDESDDFEIWCPNWAAPTGPGLVITFMPKKVIVEWGESKGG